MIMARRWLQLTDQALLNGIGGTPFILSVEVAARAQGWSTGAGWEIASEKALRGKIGSIRISQIVIPKGPNIVSSSTNYNPGESGLAA